MQNDVQLFWKKVVCWERFIMLYVAYFYTLTSSIELQTYKIDNNKNCQILSILSKYATISLVIWKANFTSEIILFDIPKIHVLVMVNCWELSYMLHFHFNTYINYESTTILTHNNSSSISCVYMNTFALMNVLQNMLLQKCILSKTC